MFNPRRTGLETFCRDQRKTWFGPEEISRAFPYGTSITEVAVLEAAARAAP